MAGFAAPDYGARKTTLAISTGDGRRGWGNPKAVTAMARKLARVLWHLLKYQPAFDWKVFEKEES